MLLTGSVVRRQDGRQSPKIARYLSILPQESFRDGGGDKRGEEEHYSGMDSSKKWIVDLVALAASFPQIPELDHRLPIERKAEA